MTSSFCTLSKILSVILLLVCICTSSFAQDETFENDDTKDSTVIDADDALAQLFGSPIQLEVDTLLYPKKVGNFYSSESPEAMIMSMVAPEPLEKLKEDLKNEPSRNDVTITENGEFIKNGKTFIFQKGTMKKEGNKYIFETYALKADEKRTIMVVGYYDPKAKNKYGDTIKKAAVSAKLLD